MFLFFGGGGRFSRPRALPSSMIRTPSSGTLQQHAPRSISVPPGCETGCGSRTGSPGGGSVTSSIGSPITTPGFPGLPPAPGSAPGSARFANPGPPYHGKFYIFQKKCKKYFPKNVFKLFDNFFLNFFHFFQFFKDLYTKLISYLNLQVLQDP